MMARRCFTTGIWALTLGLPSADALSTTALTADSPLPPLASQPALAWGSLHINQGRRAGDAGEPALQMESLGRDVVVLRQSKTVHYEAPFLYLVFGEKRALLLDTGADCEVADFPLRGTIEALLQEHYGWRRAAIELIVAHTHGHSDHRGGDAQFIGQAGTRVLNPQEAPQFFGINHWPEQIGSIDLGERSIAVIPIPGHEGRDLAFYDAKTGLLFSGDSLYPGRIYIRHWTLFRQSLDRLVNFLEGKPVTAILGAHIELGDQGTEYPAGTLVHEDELPLPLDWNDLLLLHERVRALEAAPVREVHPHFILVPLLGPVDD